MLSRPVSGAVSSWKTPSTPARERAPSGSNTFGERARQELEPLFGWALRLVRIARWTLARVALLYPVRWFSWQTARDERTCPECSALDGHSWPEDRSGPEPPLHVNCRCRVAHSRTEWRVRYVPQWQQRWTNRQTWEWTRTGWA